MRVIIWGCGDFGKHILQNLIQRDDMEIVAYTDSNEKLWGCKCRMFPVISPKEIHNMEFDFLFIAVSSLKFSNEIKKELRNLGIEQGKIIDLFSDRDYMDLFIDQRIAFIRGYANWINENKIEGNVAECGVFRGDSAKFLNRYFKDRKLYLCDTFESFDINDLEIEKAANNARFLESGFADQSCFSDTTLEFVMSKMTRPENVVIKKGYFPDSMVGTEDKFCFVNLDMDLYIPMLEGLRYFWDKMVPGGCILLHDYFSDIFTGVKQAVDDFEREIGMKVVKSPIGDGCSIALFRGQYEP